MFLNDSPDWLVKLAHGHTKKQEPAPVATKEPEKIAEGMRNAYLISYAGTMRRRGIQDHRLFDIVNDENQARCSPPLEENEVRKVIVSSLKYQIVKRTDQEALPLNDCYTARWFLDLYSENQRFCAALGGWFTWRETHWQSDDDFETKRRMMAALVKLREKARLDEDKKLLAFEKASGASGKIDAALNLAKAGEGITIQPDRFDQDEWLLNFTNGTLNLETMQLQEHRREDLITRIIKYPFDLDCPAPEWEKFLKFIFRDDEEIIKFVQRAVGYALCGSTREQCIFILYGGGSNGKSTFLKALSNVFSAYAMDCPASSFVEKHQETVSNDIARLKGSRFVTSIESGRSKVLDEAKIKQLTGGDKITARFLFQEAFEFFPTFKIFFATNHKPEIRGTDKGIWRRIKTIPFERIIEESERDFGMDARLAAEYPGILAWAVRGFVDWFNGGGLRTPEKITLTTAAYQEDSDLIGAFIEDACVQNENVECSSSDLALAIKDWAEKNSTRKVYRPELLDYLMSKGFKKDRIRSGTNRGKWCWKGIGLKSPHHENAPEKEFSEHSGRPF